MGITDKNKEKCKKANEVFKLYWNSVLDELQGLVASFNNKNIIMGGVLNNLIIAKIRDKNREWNKKMKEMDIQFLDNFFIKEIKKMLIENQYLSEDLKQAARFL